MSTHEHSRRAHELVDAIKDGYTPDRADVDFLRSFLPERPKQKTLEEITAHVYDAWLASSDYEFNGNEYDPDVTIEDWLLELHKQLKGLKDMPAAVPALPAGMRLADHAEHGRIVSIGWLDEKGDHFCVYYDKNYKHGIYAFLEADSLTFVDAEPAHPEFLETEADYENAPEGTIVACEDSPPWYKFDSVWLSTVTCGSNSAESMSGIIREVLRWGWGNE